MEIEYVNPAQAGALDAFVAQHPRGYFMQTSLWGRVKTDWGWHGIVLRDGGRIRGSMALLSRPFAGLRACLLYAPRGPVTDEGDREALRALIAAARELGGKLGAFLLRVDPFADETSPAVDTLRALGFRLNAADDFSLFLPRHFYTLELAGRTPEELEHAYRSSTRNNLHKARRLGVTVRRCGGEELPAFCRMMEQVGQKNHFQPRSEAYYRSFLRGLGPAARLYLAEREAEPIGAAICVMLGRRCVHMYGCSDRAGLKAYPNELLQWQMQSDAIRAGCRIYDFGGVQGLPTEDNPHLGLHRFKQGFGGRLQSCPGQFDLPLRRGIWLLYKAACRAEGV